MAQPNVAREPSMEEILASIRRIIENNDPVEAIGNASYSPQRSSAPETIELTIDEDIALMSAGSEPSRSATPAVQHTESVAAQRMPDKVEQPAARPMSLADVAARVKAASERRTPAAPANDTDRQVPTSQADVSPAHSVSEGSVIEAEPAPVQLRAAAQTFSQQYHEPMETFLAPVHSAAPEVMPEVPLYVEPQSPAPVHHNAEAAMDHYEIVNEVDEPAVDVTEEPSLDPIERFAVQIGNEVAASVPAQLLSPVAEEKVSRSFEELVNALGSSTRSLDEIAAEMLKPMLQDWLDDNLPTLVERLVREEIERVARGPRR